MPDWNGSRHEELWKMLDSIKSVLFIFIPFLTILVTTIWILTFLKKVTNLSRQNIPLVLSVAILHLISFMPFLAYVITMNILKPSREVKYRTDTVAQLWATAVYLNYLNTMSNPVLYYFTSASFKTYVRRWWMKVRGEEGGGSSGMELSTASNLRGSVSVLSGNKVSAQA